MQIDAMTFVTVLAAKMPLPSVLEVIDPDSSGRAVPGVGVPLEATDKSELLRPMERGTYAFAAKGRTTVLHAKVMSIQEANYNPQTFLNSPYSQNASPELRSRIAATWSMIQLTFASHDPDVCASLDFMHQIASQLATLTDGVISDSIIGTYTLPSSGFLTAGFQVTDHVQVNADFDQHMTIVRTHGLLKILQPELRLFDVGEELVPLAKALLEKICLQIFQNGVLSSGDTVKVGHNQFGLQVPMNERLQVKPTSFDLVPLGQKTINEILLESMV